MTKRSGALVPRVLHAPQREHPRVRGPRPIRCCRQPRGVLRGAPHVGPAAEAAAPKGSPPPYKSFLEEHRPGLRFHYRAIEHLLNQVLQQEAFWDTFFEHTGIKPILVLYESFAGDYTTSTIHLLERLGLPAPVPAMHR